MDYQYFLDRTKHLNEAEREVVAETILDEMSKQAFLGSGLLLGGLAAAKGAGMAGAAAAAAHPLAAGLAGGAIASKMAPRAINEARGVLEKVAPKGEAELRETIRQQKGEINTLKPMAEHAQDLQKKIGLRNKLALGGTVAGAGGLAYGLNEKKKSQQPYSGTMESYQ